MTVTNVSLSSIENAIREVCLALDERGNRAPSWPRITEDNLWRELVACILGSRVRFEAAHAAMERMEGMRLLCHSRRSARFDQYEHDVLEALSGKSVSQVGTAAHGRYPFFRTRANQIRRTAERFYENRDSIREFLAGADNVREVRRRLVSEVSGLGPKQASLFLRNIGYAVDVAVLDVHVLTYMSWAGLTNTLTKSVSTVRKYEMLEDAFIKHSYSFGHPPNRFDVAVWVVMKVARDENKT